MYVPCAVKMSHLFDSSLSICFIFRAVKMSHLLTAACQYVSYFVRWTNGWLCFFHFWLYCTYVACAVKMSHLLTAACQYVSYFLRCTLFFSFLALLCACPLCCKDVTSFDSSLSICFIFRQVDKRLALFFHFWLYCTYVPCAVKMSHLLTAACQYVSYFVRWTNDWLYLFHFWLYCAHVPCAVKMSHLLTAVIFD